MEGLNDKLAALYADFAAGRITPDAFFAEVYELTLRPLIFHILAKQTGMPRDEATDVAHDVYIALVQTMRKKGPNFEAPILPWLKLVATNRIIDETRILRRNAMRQYEAESGHAPSCRRVTEADLARSLDIEKRLAMLTERQREIVLLSAEDGCTHNEIADMLGIPATTVAHEIRVARQKMKELP